MSGLLVREFGAAVRRLREASGWSQEQLAEYAGLNRSYVGEIERGSAIASIVTLDKLARAFGVPVERLLGDASVPPDAAALTHAALAGPAAIR
ncbi:Transcriptional regulator ClgR [Burkholderia sp. AD24]|jgi:transcriptional regulator with XRE-family HTH domain|uniref:Helix-turn-helix protein n=1 Tax=Paraburkholderia bryophila TaxID=420952 RepID=A0A329D4E4_9BURK|nr:helix-turn-helix transcriptional regulator [Paraburkholderia bryophila]ASL42197.1 Transcriptional regulator ClgR [Burkholderia sp. AD24]RAS37475.1 helix-turn-helix protein [Paraburkholderia bryophila]WCM21698.1 helix-turn-helix domain-containing protein [Paraburkholderia bryophila]